MTILEWIAKNPESRYPSRSEYITACAESVGCGSRRSVIKALSKIKQSGQKDTRTVKIATNGMPMKECCPKKGISEKDLRSKHDNLYKIRETVKKLAAGTFVPDSEFREMCGVSPNVYRSYADKSEFSKYKGRASGVVYWGHPTSIERMKSDHVLQ